MRLNHPPRHTAAPSEASGRLSHPLSAEDLRAHASAYRTEAAMLSATLEHLTPSAAHQARIKASRYRSLAGDLERAAQRKEAIGA